MQSSPNVSNEDKVLIGVTVRGGNQPTPVPPPALSPVVSVVSVTGRQVRIQLRDGANQGSRRRPFNAAGATILTYSDAPPPANDPGWTVQGQTGKNIAVVEFPSTVQAGTACWITCMWYSRRGEYSPACPPVLTYLQIGSMAQAA